MTSPPDRPKPADAGRQAGMGAEIREVGGVRYLLQDGPDLINTHLRDGRVWEAHTVFLAQTLLRDVAAPLVVDVGANLGAFAVPMGQWLAERAGRLVAFEPQRLVYYQLCANLFLNRLGHCEAHLLAVGAQAGQVDVPRLDPAREVNLGALSLDAGIRRDQRQLSSLSTQSDRVPMVTLSGMGLPPAHLIKVDVEGLELEVLTGAKAWLESSGHPPILFEVWGEQFVAFRPKREMLLRYVSDELGYEISLLGELCVAQHPACKRFDITCNHDRSITLTPLNRPIDRPAATP
jgi:FkbM family methyltransferase